MHSERYPLRMRSKSLTDVVLIREAFDRRALRLGLTRPGPDGKPVPSNSAIARHLGMAQSTVSRARAGGAVGPELIATTIRRFDLPYARLFQERAPV